MTAQRKDSIIYKEQEYGIATEPLLPFLEKNQHIKIKSNVLSTACWRGYIAHWLVENDKLFLIDLDDAGENRIGLDDLFPCQDKVFAEWFSGYIRITAGKRLLYIHMGYESIYEKDIVLEIENGVIVSETVFDNDDALNKIAESKKGQSKTESPFIGLYHHVFYDLMNYQYDILMKNKQR